MEATLAAMMTTRHLGEAGPHPVIASAANEFLNKSDANNDERTAKRVSDALGTATEMRAMNNYAGHWLSPWLGHLMVSRQETARPLLTPGEVMQLPPGAANRRLNRLAQRVARQAAHDPGDGIEL